MSHRVDFVAPPFAGHLHPILGLGRALAADGHAVRVFSTERAAADIAAAGLEGVALLAGVDPAIREIVDPPRPVRSNPVRLLRQLRGSVALLGRFRAELDAHWEQRRPDLAIVDFALPAGGWLAQARGISWWTSHPAPCVIEGARWPARLPRRPLPCRRHPRPRPRRPRPEAHSSLQARSGLAPSPAPARAWTALALPRGRHRSRVFTRSNSRAWHAGVGISPLLAPRLALGRPGALHPALAAPVETPRGTGRPACS